MNTIRVPVIRLPHSEGLDLPRYQSTGAAGLDLVAAIAADDQVSIAPGQRRLVPTGLAIALPDGYEAQVRPRSGLALKNGVTVLNAPGTVDSDYRGEIGVILINLGDVPFVIARGDRIAQMVVAPVSQLQFEEASELATSERGAGGFGSTGGRDGAK